MRTILVVVIASCLTIGIYTFSNKSSSKVEESSTFIVQGGVKQKLLADVDKVGGEFVKEFKYINAYSVLLTEPELSELKSLNPQISVFKDESVKISSKKTSKKKAGAFIDPALLQSVPLLERALTDTFSESSKVTKKLPYVAENKIQFALDNQAKFVTNEKTITWTVANDNTADSLITAFAINYPIDNGAVFRIKINNKKVRFHQSLDRTIALTEPVDLGRSNDFEVSVAFEQLTSGALSDYSFSVDFENGTQAVVQHPDKNIYQGKERDTFITRQVRANALHQEGITGYGVNVAIIDTGIAGYKEMGMANVNANSKLIYKDLLSDDDNLIGRVLLQDSHGHGTHLASIISNITDSVSIDDMPDNGSNGIAPDAGLVVVRAFDENGQASYTTVLEALEYVLDNHKVHNIRVLNLSFSARPSSHYWDDPINQMIMRLWDAGVTVVAASGNRGSNAMTIGVPGNTPYIITVGAMSDNATPYDGNDDFVTKFSSSGPTYEGFLKPEIVAPGSRVQGLIANGTFIRNNFSMYDNDPFNEHDYFELSGTSQSTAVTAGVVALMLQANPELTPNDVKCRLLDSARVAIKEDGSLAFSIFQQGSGLIDAYSAVKSTTTGCANQGMSIAKELADEEHYIGPARFNDETRTFYIAGIDGLEWNGFYNDAQLWRRTSMETDAQLWRKTSFNSNGQLWRHTSFESNAQLWRHTNFITDGQLWRNTSFDADAQLWRRTSFNSDAQLWRRTSFNADSYLQDGGGFGSDSILNKWVDHE